MSNLVVETDAADNYKPSKKKSTERIDGPVALIMALGRAITQPITLTYDRAAVFI
jgi:phage terminase large subunit-like protein